MVRRLNRLSTGCPYLRTVDKFWPENDYKIHNASNFLEFLGGKCALDPPPARPVSPNSEEFPHFSRKMVFRRAQIWTLPFSGPKVGRTGPVGRLARTEFKPTRLGRVGPARGHQNTTFEPSRDHFNPFLLIFPQIFTIFGPK